MAEERAIGQLIESILVADCGAVFTKLLLLESVEDETAQFSYRFVAQAETLTTLDAPWNDLSVGVVNAIEEIEQITGRTLYRAGRLITPQYGLEGVDAFVVVLSAPEPLSLVIAGLVREMSLESARRAVSGTYADIKTILSRERSLDSPQTTWSRTVRDIAPDVVLLVGGVDGGARRPVMELAEAIALAASMVEQEQRPVVLYAGNTELRPHITKLIGDITHVKVVDNVHPTVDTEHLGPAQSALEQLYIDERMNTAPGAETLLTWSRLPLLPTATAFARVVNYLRRREDNADRGVLGIDVGAATTTVAASFEDRSYVTIYDKGIAYGPLAWVQEHGVAPLFQWLPEEMEEEELLVLLHNWELRPWTVPQDPRELWVEQAVVREMLRSALAMARPTWDTGKINAAPDMLPGVDPILISGGGLVHMPRPGQALLSTLDGLQPTGISTILLDINRAAPALGAVAGLKPLAAVSALESGTPGAGALVSLGTVISPVGKARPGEVVLRMRIAYEDGGTLDVEARYGDIEIWPLLPGQKATLTLRPNRRFDVGMGFGRGGKVQVVGGLIGLVVDARGRPLALPEDADRRRRALHGWIWDVGG